MPASRDGDIAATPTRTRTRCDVIPISADRFGVMRSSTVIPLLPCASLSPSLDHNSGTPARRASEEMLQVDTPSSLALRVSMRCAKLHRERYNANGSRGGPGDERRGGTASGAGHRVVGDQPRLPGRGRRQRHGVRSTSNDFPENRAGARTFHRRIRGADRTFPGSRPPETPRSPSRNHGPLAEVVRPWSGERLEWVNSSQEFDSIHRNAAVLFFFLFLSVPVSTVRFSRGPVVVSRRGGTIAAKMTEGNGCRRPIRAAGTKEIPFSEG